MNEFHSSYSLSRCMSEMFFIIVIFTSKEDTADSNDVKSFKILFYSLSLSECTKLTNSIESPFGSLQYGLIARQYHSTISLFICTTDDKLLSIHIDTLARLSLECISLARYSESREYLCINNSL